MEARLYTENMQVSLESSEIGLPPRAMRSRGRRVEVELTIKIAGHGTIVSESPDYVTIKSSLTKITINAKARIRM